MTIDMSSLPWEVTNDSVMGGVSNSAVTLKDSAAVFSGYATTDSNGGFAIARAKLSKPHDWSGCNGISLRIKGDGLKYVLILANDLSRWAPTYEVAVTPNDSWETLYIPWTDFEGTPFWATPFASVDPLDKTSLRSLGIKRTAFSSGTRKDPSFTSGRFRVELGEISCMVR